MVWSKFSLIVVEWLSAMVAHLWPADISCVGLGMRGWFAIMSPFWEMCLFGYSKQIVISWLVNIANSIMV